MTTKIALGLDTNHNVTYELPVSDAIYGATLAANTALSLTIPPNMTRAFFSASNGTDFWVNYSTTATIPGGSFSQINQELNPVARYQLTPGSTLSFISPTTCYINVAFYSNNINGF